VTIVGAGFTGLWTAYYLLQERPDLSVAIIEKEFAGFGASGRNGGWLSAEPPGNMALYAKSRGTQATLNLQHAMFETVDEVIQVADEHQLEASIIKDGLLYVATNDAQLERLRQRVEDSAMWGWGPEDIFMLNAAELAPRVNVEGAVGALYTPHGARVDPGRLVRGLADVVESLGGKIYEDTTALQIDPGVVHTDRGKVYSTKIGVTLEGYQSKLPGRERRMLPMNSSMIITEPLSDEIWDEIGWRGAETLGDAAHGFTYTQRTDDGRIALGGRGVPYNFANSFDWNGRTDPRAVETMIERLNTLFPATRGVPIAHTWTGILGVPRDWSATVSLNPRTGIGVAGGYVGHGVSGTNLAGRTLKDFILEQDTELTRLGWVDRSPRKWEPEPLRWLGATTFYQVYEVADKQESEQPTNTTSPLARIANTIAGRG
jgi:glycine/D-amino acid oxidase-like deaminating enzyme